MPNRTELNRTELNSWTYVIHLLLHVTMKGWNNISMNLNHFLNLALQFFKAQFITFF